MSVLLCEIYTGCQSLNDSCKSSVFSSTKHHLDLDSRQTTSDLLYQASHCHSITALTVRC